MELALYGLLHLERNERSAMNFSPQDYAEQVALYVRNALTLSASLGNQGVPFTLLTNQRDTIEGVLRSERGTLRVEEIPFITRVPAGARFYSAHFKLDAFRYLSSLTSAYVGLCDLDMVCLSPIPASMANNIQANIPFCYDISDQVWPAYGRDTVLRDLELLLEAKSEGRWSGGEFLAGPPAFFSRLIGEIDQLFERYARNIATVHHVGDEMITSAALERIRKAGVYVADAGTLGVVGRYWNARVLHPQRPFDYYKRCFLLHLPADKGFLASLSAGVTPGPLEVVAAYERYLNSPRSVAKRMLRRLMPR